MSFMIKVPGSSANLGPGFDSIGLAVNRYLTLEVVEADDWLFQSSSKELENNVPTGEDNLICQVAKHVAKELGYELTPCEVTMTSDIPLARGLGSSAAAIVAGIELANQLIGDILSADEKVRFASLWEGHPENVAASVYGGLVIGTHSADETTVMCGGTPDVDLVLLIPSVELKTKESRGVLPEELSYEQAVKGSGVANVLVAAMLQGNWKVAGEMMNEDIFHQPYRKTLVPHLEEVIQVAIHETEAYGAALSGAGPTILCVTPKHQGKATQDILKQRFPNLEIDVLSPAPEGITVHQGIKEL